MRNKPEEFRTNAQDALNQADKCRKPEDKERWLKIAQDWLRLAQEIENQK